MNKINKITKLLTEKEAKTDKKETQKEILENNSLQEVDRDALGKIVSRMRGKYINEGVLTESSSAVSSEDSKIKMLISGERDKIGIGASAKELALYDSPIIRFMGRMYLVLESPMSAAVSWFKRRFGQRLDGDLLSAQMNYSSEQYISLALTATLFSLVISALFMGLLALAGTVSLAFFIIMSLAIPLVILFIVMQVPSNKAQKLGAEIEKELPFALRHMSIEIRAGVGIYKTMESIAKSGYGPLSDGFRWVLFQIEKGVPTEEALQAWADRTRSDALQRIVSHLVRALRTGGNLSEVMITIADDVAFERRAKIADFAEKLNLLGLFLMMGTVVLPVMITILTTIASTPSISSVMGMFSFFSPTFLMIVYFIVVPAMVGLFIYYIRSSDPG